jgi:nitroreductase
MSPAALDEAAGRLVARNGADHYGRWVHYPWRRALVRVLAPDHFVELRTSRNRYKITLEEQERLASATIGLVGLSAGHSIALCLALERVGTKFRLADFDAMELSNMNRVACGITSLGVNKAVLTARQLYELDPYLDISVFTEGITEQALTPFFDGGGRLDVLIEECDDLYMKVRLREEAKARGIPVVMETNDRGLLDVERFDVERDRPVFHGLLDGARSSELRGLDTEGKTPFMLRILGIDMSPRLAASLIEIDKTISGWPQLGSGNMLGGALVTDVTRRALLGQHAPSGRYSVDLEGLVPLTTESPARFTPTPDGAAATVRETQPTRVEATRQATPTRQEIEWLVHHASLAPSGGNDQPWRFIWRKGSELDCYLDRSHSGSFLDFEHSASYLALGAAAENAAIAATALRRPASITVFPVTEESDLVFRVSLGEASAGVAASPLLPALSERATNRRLAERRPLDRGHAQALVDAAREREAELSLVTDPTVLSEIGAFLGEVDRFRFLCERLHTAMMSELRFSPEEARSTRDGIDVATLELDAVGMAGLRLLSNPKTSSFLRSLGQGVRLEASARRSIAAASAVGLLSVAGTDARAHVHAGRAVERVWLEATRLGLAFQPMSVAPYLFARLTRGNGEGFTSPEIDRLRGLHECFRRIFPSVPDRAEPMLFRIAEAPAPSVRALRRPIGAVLSEV